MDSDRSVAHLAVRRAIEVCRSAREHLGTGHTLIKGDRSPVTVADFAAQAVVCATLAEYCGDDLSMVAEEDPNGISVDANIAAVAASLVTEGLNREIDPGGVAELLGLGRHHLNAARFWTLDPIDGTKGFLRGDQYAVALALIEHGEVVLGVLGCPNLPNPDGSVGAVLIADESGCQIVTDTTTTTARVVSPERLADARLCESVEVAHSDHGLSAAVAALLGLDAEPYRIDSQCKYASVARGDASIYLRLPTLAGYREKIWDHAAGFAAVQRAGGRVTDIDGSRLDFSRGPTLAANRGVVATDGRFHDEVIAAIGSAMAHRHIG
jgi:HAL2 family 3'(2'),5'-bisphosphate nucleotidase